MNEKMRAVPGWGMLIFGAVVTLVLALSDCPAQTNTSLTFQPTNEIYLTLTNRQGRVYNYIKVVKILPDGIFYTVTDGAGGGKIIFADIPEKYRRMLVGMSPLEQLKDKANTGDDQAMMQLGTLYATGSGVPTNTVEAEQWYTRAANLGNSNAATALGFMLFDGLGEMDFRESGFLSNYFKASNWFRVAAEAGQPYAQIELARYYRPRWSNTNLTDQELTNEEAEAFKWYDKAFKTLSERAKGGDKSAQEKLDMWHIDAPESWIASNKPAALRPVTTPRIVQPRKIGEMTDDPIFPK